MSMILQAAQGANWQRGGGKGEKPTRIKRPDDRPPQVRTSGDLAARREAQRELLKQRRAAKDQRGA